MCRRCSLVKNIHVFYGKFRFFREIQITPFCHWSKINGSAQCINLPPLCSFKVDMNSFLCWLNVQIAGNSLHLIFDLIVSWYISAIVAVKKKKSDISFKSNIRPSCPISEITTSHVCRLTRPEKRAIKNNVFL